MLAKITPTQDPYGFRIEGELDLAAEPAFSAALEEASARSGQVILDFSGVSFMDSSGLRVLLRAASSMDGQGPRLIVLHPTRAVRRVFEISIPGGAPGLEIRE
jgi:anti-sigma B factor antagonist